MKNIIVSTDVDKGYISRSAALDYKKNKLNSFNNIPSLDKLIDPPQASSESLG